MPALTFMAAQNRVLTEARRRGTLVKMGVPEGTPTNVRAIFQFRELELREFQVRLLDVGGDRVKSTVYHPTLSPRHWAKALAEMNRIFGA